MGNAGNKRRKESRRFREAAASLMKDYREAQQDFDHGEISREEYLAAKKRAEEQMAWDQRLEQASKDDEARYQKFLQDNQPDDGLDDPLWEDISPSPREPKKEKEVVDAEAAKFKTTMMKDNVLDYPALNLQVFLACHDHEEISFAEMLVRTGCMKARSLEEADLIIFGGGADVDPSYYGETSVHRTTHSNEARDAADVALYYEAYCMGIPMVGICRGAQFLHVMNGGKLYQDVDNHGRAHPIVDVSTGEIIQKSSSVHHQMCMDPGPRVGGNVEARFRANGMEIVAIGNVSRNRVLPDCTRDTAGKIDDIEAFFYRDTACLGFQGHPEYKGFNYYTLWCLKQIENYIVNNPDLAFMTEGESKGFYRIKPDVLAIRDHIKEGVD